MQIKDQAPTRRPGRKAAGLVWSTCFIAWTSQNVDVDVAEVKVQQIIVGFE
jgi:hypothetical protein